MSLLDRRQVLVVALGGVLALSGCTIAPVHANRAAVSGQGQKPLRYAEPSGRREQVFYQALSQRLGTAQSPDAPILSASVSVSSTRIGLSTRPSPVTDRQIVASATYRIRRNNIEIASGTRTATSGYQTTGQIVADDSARTAAEEDAIRAVAEAVRLAILALPDLP